jgi:hypothetical protein
LARRPAREQHHLSSPEACLFEEAACGNAMNVPRLNQTPIRPVLAEGCAGVCVDLDACPRMKASCFKADVKTSRPGEERDHVSTAGRRCLRPTDTH